MKWISIKNKLPDDGIEVLGYSKEWIHPDFNLSGTRICFLGYGGEWVSAKWNNDQDHWHTHSKIHCSNSEKEDFSPTHWTPLPQPPKR